uniref:Protein BREVIS RADIX n=1 Tax=Anthurium amnicola TaxID=1678845 RepID=A0A1D1YUW3_9ARAE
MLTCIACSKRLRDAAEDEPARGTPSTKEAVKSLTSQIKEMVLRFSGVYRQCKPCTGGASTSSSGAHRKGGAGVGHHGRPYGNFDVSSEAGGGAMGSHYQHLMAGGSSTSTPGWDFTSINAESADARFTNGGGARWWAPGIGMPGVDRPREEVGPYDVVLEEDDGEPKEWMAQVEPGVHITFISLPGGGNDLKRIRFSREMFNKWQAQRWWGENYDRIMELYNVQRFSRQALPTPPRSEDERDSSYSRVGSTRESPVTPPPGKDRVLARNAHRATGSGGSATGANGKGVLLPVPDPTEHLLQCRHGGYPAPVPNACWRGETSSLDASRTTTSSRDEASVSVSNGSDQDTTEWVEQDEPGVYITIRQLPDGARELRRVRFSREHFSEKDAKQWWEENRERIQAQYL